MTHKFCIRNREDRCIQCRDYAPKKRVCPAYRIKKEQRKDKQPKPLATWVDSAGFRHTRFNFSRLKKFVDSTTADSLITFEDENGAPHTIPVEAVRELLEQRRTRLPED